VHFKSPARLHTAALAFVLSLSLTSAAPFASAAPRAGAAALRSIHIDNFGSLGPTYYRGAQPKGRDYADLASLGVKAVINLTSDDASADEQALAQKAGMAYFQIPMTTRIVPTAAQLAQFLSIVTNPANQPVYVHCVGGRHRTGVMSAVYRIAHDGWNADRAFKEMKQFKFGADFLHPEFKKFVYGFHPDVARVAEAAGTR